MKHLVLIAAVALPLALGGCPAFNQAASTACADIAKMPPAAVVALDAQDPHTAVGVLWADAKAACVAGVPALGVGESFGAMVWGEMKVLIPQVLPELLPILVGLI